MSLVDRLRYRLRVLLRGRSYQRELDEEVEFHLSLEAMHQRHDAGQPLADAEAAARARRKFGNVTYQREETRAMSGLGWLDEVGRDLRFAWRGLRATPGFTLIAVATLAIGIGANTAIFSAVNAMLLRPLPFREPDRLMAMSITRPAHREVPARTDVVWSYPKFAAFRRAQSVFQDLALYLDAEVSIRAGDTPERVELEEADAHYLTALGIVPVLGRNFSPEDDRAPGGPRNAIIGYRLWERLFNRDPAVIGKPLAVGDVSFTIAGVLPPDFRGLSGRAEALLSLMAEPADQLGQAWSHSYSAVGRLRPGVSPKAAIAATEVAGGEVDRAFPNPELATEHWGATARPLDATRVDPVVRRSLVVLLAAVGLVLLIACANVANLFLVRSAGRRREIAVRLAIGAGRRRLVRQLLTESLLLAAIGGIASLLVAWGGVSILSRLDPTEAFRVQRLTGLGVVDFRAIRLDLPALGFALLLVIATGLAFGLVPALQSTRLSLTDGLKESDRAASSHRGARSRSALTVLEIALALVLLAGSGLMLKSLGKLLGVHPGFDAERMLTLRLNSREGFSRDSLPAFYDQVLERLGAIPGVASVGLADCSPLSSGCNRTSIVFRDQPPPKPGNLRDTGIHWISPSWPATMRVPLRAGRFLTSADRAGRQKVVLVNETAARTFWPGQSAIGKPVSVGQGGFWDDTAYVAGVVGDVRYHTIDSLPRADVYLSYYQSPRGRMMLFLRTTGDPMALARTVTDVLRQIAPDIPVYDVQAMESRVALATAPARFSALLLAAFAAVALALAALGIYGVISFAVSQRTREIGIRSALGAGRADVVRMVVGQGIVLATAGAAMGVVAALAATRVLQSLLYEVTPSDPATFIAIVALVGAVAVLASWLPARRAAKVEPVEALRTE